MHAAGWVHGDLKPGNVLLMADRSVRLADFGLARELDGTHAYAPRLGSSDYLPPEWWSERVSEQGVAVRPTADIWALGVTAHQVLTGGLPVRGRDRTGARCGRPGVRGGPSRAAAGRRAAGAVASDRRRLPRPGPCLTARAQRRFVASEDRRGAGHGRTQAGRATRVATAAAVAGAVLLAAASAGAIASTTGDRTTRAGASVEVYNAKAPCRHSLRAACRLGLAGDPRAKYAPANVVGHVRHGDRLAAECWIGDGTPVMAEDQRTSTRWYRVRIGTQTAWLPGVRTWPGATPAVGRCKG